MSKLLLLLRFLNPSSMKALKLILACLLFISNVAFAQDCGTIPSEQQIEYLNSKRYQRQSYTQTRSSIMWFPIQNHIIKESNCTGGISTSEIDGIMNDLNEYYLGSGIQFYQYNYPNNICDSDNYDFIKLNEDVCNVNDINNVINIYYANSITNTSSGDELCGYAYFPSWNPIDRIIMKNSCAINGSTIIHEVGHYFSLYHTHGFSYTDDELVNGTNCITAGDELCDTPADPTLTDVINENCYYTGTSTDSNGDYYSPSTTNFMSYSRKECRDNFTTGQHNRISYSAENERNYLMYGYSNPTLYGCADSLAVNYNYEVTHQDNSCEYYIQQHQVSLALTTDCYANDETSWEIKNSNGDILYSSIVGDYMNEETYSSFYLLNPGQYTFTIFDTFGDGLNGSQWPNCNVDGFFQLTDVNGMILVSPNDIDFGLQESFEFNIELDTIFGCTDENACNYSQWFQLFDEVTGLPVYTTDGLPQYIIQTPNIDDGTCEYPVIENTNCDGFCENSYLEMNIEYNNGEVLSLLANQAVEWGGVFPTSIDSVEIVQSGTIDNISCDSIFLNLNGKIVVIDRGDCQYGDKAINAQNSGAIAVIIKNNTSGIVNMSGGDLGYLVTIPVIMITNNDGNLINDIIVQSEGSLLCNIYSECTNGTLEFGCTDNNAANYNPDAYSEDGSCEYYESNQAQASTLFSGVNSINIGTLNGLNYLIDIDRRVQTKYINENGDTALYQNTSSEWNDNHFVYGLEMYNSAHDPSGIEYFDDDEDIYFKIISNGIVKDLSETMHDNSGYRLYEQDITELDDDYSIQFWDYDSGNSDDLYATINYSSLNSNNMTYYNYNTDYTMYLIDYKLYRSNNNPHLDAHWGVSKAHDYFFETFGRNGFNDNNGIIENVFTNSTSISAPAYYDSNNRAVLEYKSDSMKFNFNSNFNSKVGIDNIGNDFANLIALSISENREGENGALATSFGNIFGVCIERYAKPNEWNWLIGEYAELPVLEYPNIDITDNYDISLSNPSLSDTPQATYYQGDGWDTDGNIYINSGVQNLWFHNLSSGTAFLNNDSQLTAIEGVGVDKAAIILYNNFLNLPDTATYYNAFINSMSVCDSIYGSGSIEKNQMMLAWESVGLYSIYGCTNPIAFNFDTQANTDDGSCISIVYGCTDSTAYNYDEDANTDNDTCIEVIEGCIDILAFNFEYTANTNNGTCYPIIYGCFDYAAYNFILPEGNELVDVNTEDGTCYPIIYGCMDENAFNYIELVGDNSIDINTANESCISVSFGCTDNSMYNFDILANTDDGSCINVSYGCIDSTAFNYNENSNTDNGSCIQIFEGCTNNSMYNYDNEANTDDGTCVAHVYGCMDETALNYNVEANANDNSCIGEILGCTNSTMFNYDNDANTDDGTCVPYVYGCMDETALNYNIEANANDNSCITEETGCTDNGEIFEDLVNNITGGLISDGIDDDYHYDIDGDGLMALNYNPNANSDDGSCNPVVYGCTDIYALNYNVNATTDDETCIIEIFGCTDPLALNYNSIVTTDNGNCIYSIGCKDPNYIEYNEVAIETDNTLCLTLIIEGCTDEAYLEYNLLANILNQSYCINLIEYGCTDETAFNYSVTANTNDGSCEEIVLGCTNPLAFNYTIEANTENGSCVAVVYGCIDSNALNYNLLANTDNGTCIEITEGCTDNTAFNYNEFANVDDNSCIAILYGCIDAEAFNYNEEANTDNGTCEDIILGCIDEQALNYDAEANTDNATCIALIYGCVDANAENYNSNANTTDESCEYSEYVDLLSTYCYPDEDYNSATHHILRFTLDTLDSGYNTSLSNGSSTYTDNSDMVVGLEVGSTYTTSINLIHQTYGGQIGADIYIDYNRDGDFEEENEKCVAYTNNFGYNSTGTHNIITSITVPEGIIPGLTKIRVVTYLLSEFPASTNHSCITNYQGEIEDYTANLINDVLGCTDSLAENFNYFATTDDGGCDYLGCTNVNSTNYNSDATIDDYSCIFSTEFNGYDIFLQPFASYEPLKWAPYGASLDFIFDEYGSSNGEANTESIVEFYGTEQTYAAKYCYELEGYGYSDWYLPSTDELGAFRAYLTSEWTMLDYYSNTEITDFNNPNMNIGCCYTQPNTSAGVFYWSSNESNQFGKASLTKIFEPVGWMDTKTNNQPVRCVRNNAMYGCTFENSFNYDSTATLDDGTCDSLPTSQSIVLPNGWSMFSTYIDPTNTNMMDVLSPIVGVIAIAKDYLGGAYLPEWGFNGIGDITDGQAYQIKIENLSESNTEIELTISGSYLLPENTPIQLESGWNMIGYLRTDEVSAVSILADINDAGNLIIAKDYLGNVYLPEWGFNGIGLMEPGKGYQVKTIAEGTLWYLPMSQEYRNNAIDKTDNTTIHYGQSKITDHNMSIVILDEAWAQKPSIGSEIAVFNKAGVQVASAQYTSPVSVLTVWGNDVQTDYNDGLLKNESFTLKLWDSEKRKELELKVSSWISGGNFYETNAIHQIGSISQEKHASDSFEFISCVPNPANSKTTINVQLSKQSHLKLFVTNILGEQLITKDKYELDNGLNKINLQTSSLEPGAYFVHLVINGINQTKVLSIIK